MLHGLMTALITFTAGLAKRGVIAFAKLDQADKLLLSLVSMSRLV